MIAGPVFAVLSLVLAAPDLESAIAATREGRFADALRAAESEPDPARRAQAELYVRHHAGDLEGALRVAADARRAGLTTAWLEERETFVALSVRDAVRARKALADLAARPDGGGAEISQTAADYRVELDALETTIARRDRAIVLARSVVAAGTALVLAAFAWLGLTGGRERRSRCSDRTGSPAGSTS